MKNIFNLAAIVFVSVLIVSCFTQRRVTESRNGKIDIRDTVAANDSTEYELIIFDPGFDFWLNSRLYSKKQYSNDYLKSINNQYVQEWNNRYQRGDSRFSNSLDYNLNTEYGLDFNYKLFMYFKFFEETNKIRLIPGRGRP